jgi:hypothetical protein
VPAFADRDREFTGTSAAREVRAGVCLCSTSLFTIPVLTDTGRSDTVMPIAMLSTCINDFLRGFFAGPRIFTAVSFVVAACATACGGSTDVAADAPATAGDLDQDGVADVADNCAAMANPTQTNEDADHLGDACDPCPPFADDDPALDQDGDGVSDACDPFPEAAGDRIVLFDGFAGPTSGSEVTGPWTFTGGAAAVRSSLNAVAAVTWTVPAAGRKTVAARATIDELFGSSVVRPVGVVQQFDRASGDGLLCVFGLDTSNRQMFSLADNRTAVALDAEPAVAGPGATSTFTLTRSGPDFRCDGSASDRELTTSSSLSLMPDRIGIFTRSASAHFAWVMIVTSPDRAATSP